MAPQKIADIIIENARIVFRNFAGKEGRFNAPGDRNFCVFIDRDLAKVLETDGWNVRWLEPREEGDEKQPYLPVKVNFANIPPKILLITSHGRSLLNEETVNALDWAEITEVDLVIHPYNWNVSGKQGIKAYVKSMYVTIAEDPLEAKYRDIPVSAIGSVGGCGHCDACDGTCDHNGLPPL